MLVGSAFWSPLPSWVYKVLRDLGGFSRRVREGIPVLGSCVWLSCVLVTACGPASCVLGSK